MAKNTHNNSALHNQQGMASMIVVVVIMLVLSLIVIGFSKLVSREQLQSLDRQLSTQAFYAAESGINDAVAAMGNPDPTKRFTGSKTDCKGVPIGSDPFNYVVNAQLGVEYSCLLIDTSPEYLEYKPVKSDATTKVFVDAGTNITRIRIGWQEVGGATAFSTASPLSLPPSGQWGTGSYGQTGMLRLALTPLPSAGNITRDNLVSQTMTAFLSPQNAAAGTVPSVPYSGVPASQGQIVAGQCHVNNLGADMVSGYSYRYCNVDIAVPAGQQFLLQLRALYRDANVTISAFRDNTAASQVELLGTQAIVDATGRVSNVFRRIRVRVPLGNQYPYPAFALESADDICKRYAVAPGLFRGDDCGDGSVSPPAPSAIPKDCADVSMPGTYFHRFDIAPNDEPVGTMLSAYTHLPSDHWIESARANLQTVLPGGRNYKVRLYSWDLHDTDNNQSNESWFIKLYDITGNLVATSDAIPDLPNPSAVNGGNPPRIHGGMYAVEVVNTSLWLPRAAVAISGRHAEPTYGVQPSTGLVNGNSIRAVCASFEPVGP